MRNQRTLLVLGAGASQGFGLPLGSGLRNLIADDLNIMFDRDWGSSLVSGSPEIVEALRILNRTSDGRSGDINPHRAAAVQISRSMRLSGSIDEYIERHKDDPLKVDCAKLAIAKSILEKERSSTIYADPHGRHDPFEKAAETWLAFLLRDITRGLTKSALKRAFEKLSIINFNYDRCVEHFCYHWFQRVYDLSENEAAEICDSIKIYHPYGSLGALPFKQASSSIPYGAEIHPDRLVTIARGIQTYSEAVDELDEPETVRIERANANKIVFLGFGFHDQNIRLLGAGSEPRRVARCFATVDGISGSRLDLIKGRLENALQVQSATGFFFDALAGNCEALWNEFGDAIIN